MAIGEFTLDYGGGFNVYAIHFDGSENAWDGSGWVDPTGIRETLATTMNYVGGEYIATLPATLPIGVWLTRAYLQMGIDPADDDPVIGLAYLTWGGGPDSIATGLRAAIAARLASDELLAELVSDRIYPQMIPERGGIPAVVWHVGSVERDRDLDGPTGLAYAGVQFEAVDLDLSIVDQIVTRLREIFDGFEGLLGGIVNVDETSANDEGDDYIGPADASDEGTHRITLGYTMMFSEPPANRGA